MSWELDHVFFATAEAEVAQAMLTAFGFDFTEHRVHPGQGTDNVCAVFDNAFFELLRARDREELDSELVRPLGLSERIRWRETGACPFGLCVRPSADAIDSRTWPFETWQYSPPYVPVGATISIVTPRRSLSEPLVFISNRPSSAQASAIPSAMHRGSRRTLTHVEVRGSPASALSPGVRWFAERGVFSLPEGSEFLLSLQWDHGRDAGFHSFQPQVPIAVHS
jgi:hypothetical protein